MAVDGSGGGIAVPPGRRDTESVAQENVETLRRAFDAFNERGLEGLLEFTDPRIEWTTRDLPRGRNLPWA
jgi:ketosteroid isomerase-like protein